MLFTPLLLAPYGAIKKVVPEGKEPGIVTDWVCPFNAIVPLAKTVVGAFEE